MSTSVQTAYSSTPAVGIAGQIADEGPREIESAANSSTTDIVAGIVVLRSADGTVRPLLSTDEPTADTDAIMVAQATATTAQVCTGATLDGVIGVTEIFPPRNITMTLSSHANFDAATAIVRGLDELGRVIEEAFEFPDAGNVTLTGAVPFRFVTAVLLPAQAGTNGTVDVGTGVIMGGLTPTARGISVYDATKIPGAYTRYDDLPVMRKGRIYVLSETAVTKGGAVYVRVVATGSEVRGAMRGTLDSTDLALLLGARWGSTLTAGGIAMVDLNLPA